MKPLTAELRRNVQSGLAPGSTSHFQDMAGLQVSRTILFQTQKKLPALRAVAIALPSIPKSIDFFDSSVKFTAHHNLGFWNWRGFPSKSTHNGWQDHLFIQKAANRMLQAVQGTTPPLRFWQTPADPGNSEQARGGSFTLLSP